MQPWNDAWRQTAWSHLDHPWDLVVIGGGITGAGILREASGLGLRALLVESGDFASGTSSRSSKLVHGGFRYLKNGQVRLTAESVRERDRLVQEARGLVNPLGFLMPCYRSDRIPAWLLGMGLSAYDLLGLKWNHRFYDPHDLRELCPSLAEQELYGGYRFFDAVTDDARLVLRLLREVAGEDCLALNYAHVTRLLRNQAGQVCGVVVEDRAAQPARQVEVQADLVINATGAWADELRSQIGRPSRLRRLRGSHLVFPFQRLPFNRAISFWHPTDGRPVFTIPWEGVTLLGTTDVDHPQALALEPSITSQEYEYLLTAAQFVFPCQGISASDVQATYAGIRPVVNTGKADPSQESREHILWSEDGLLTVTGGKLTTFRRMACAALKAACRRLPGLRVSRWQSNLFTSTGTSLTALIPQSPAARLRLVGRYGSDAACLQDHSPAAEFEPIAGSISLWAELRHAALSEAVIHLEDLLLRRVRLGLQLPGGGIDILPAIREIVQPELGWNDARWETETSAYTQLWRASYAPL